MLSRRSFLKMSGSAAAVALSPALPARGGARARVVVIGGGFGGATCAKYLRRLDAGLSVTLVEKDPVYMTCPFSNLVIGGISTLDDISYDYQTLATRHGVNLIHDAASEIDPVARRVTLVGGRVLDYDRLVLAPGIDFRFDAVPGYDEAASAILPHAWKAGDQTLLLRRQLQAMADGGTVIIAPPGNPYRCPPGPYERASMIAHYLKAGKPKSKILILDAKEKFSKQGLFEAAWRSLYGDMIEWISATDGGYIERVDPGSHTLYAQGGLTEHRGDVVNFIPPQRAGSIAFASDLVDDSGWCPVDQRSFESERHPGIHVIGDACIAGAMPKSGFSANSQAKVCAASIVAALNGRTEEAEPSYANTCYSLVAPKYGISVSAVYRLSAGKITPVQGAGGVSPADADDQFRAKEATFARGWYESIVADSFR